MQTNMLKSKIVAAGYTQNSLASAMQQAGFKMSKNTLSKKINGRAQFSIDEVIYLCKLLSICDNGEKVHIFLQ